MNQSRVLTTLGMISLLSAGFGPVKGAAAQSGEAPVKDDPHARERAASVGADVVDGPSPTEEDQVKGDKFVLIKNWDFGSNNQIKNYDDLDKEFQYHDQWNSIANGANYGAVTATSPNQKPVGASMLNLPNDQQPVDDPQHPIREFTPDSMLAHVRPLSPNQNTVSASRHDAVNGSLTAKWNLQKGGKLLGHDILWESRVRMPQSAPGFWYALWTAGTKWNKGAEMDVLESFGTPNIHADAFHVNSVGGKDDVDYWQTAWPNALDKLGVHSEDRQLADWHTFTWVYHTDDSYEVYYDGTKVQTGSLHWTFTGADGGEPVDMSFLFDFGWGHTQIPDVNIELPTSQFQLTYEIDYSRVYIR